MSDLIQIGIDVKTNIKQATSDLDKMGGSVINNIRTIDRLESEIGQLNRALDKGRVTENAYRKGMQQINGELLLFQQRASKAAQVEQRFGAAAAGGGKSLNRFNMTLQQGGYQLQDFIVQLQGGTSFFTAFSQQGSQFASIFGPKGAVIGAVIAIGSAIGGSLVAALFNARGEIKEFSDQLKETTSDLDEYFSLLKQNDSALFDAFEGNADAIRSTSQAAKDLLAIAKIKAFDSVKSLAQSLSDANTEAGLLDKALFQTDIGVTGDLLGLDTVLAGNITTWKDVREQVNGFISDVRGISQGSNIDEMYESAIRARDAFKGYVDVSGDMTDQQKSFWEQISQTILQLELLGAATKAQASDTRDLAKEQKNIDSMSVVFLKAQQRIRAENGARMEENLRLEREGYAAAAMGAQTLRNEIAANQEEMVAVFQEAQKLKEQLGEGAYEALRLAGVDMTSGIDAAAKAAAILAGNLKISLAAAQAMQSAGGGRGGDPREMGGRIIDWNTREAIAYEDALKNISKTTKKLGGTTKKTLTDAEKAAEAYAKALDDQVIGAIGGVADAWGDFVVRGFSDFKGFVSSVLNSFKSMLSNMIAMAAKNKIMLSLGIGGVGSGSVASAAGSIGSTAGNSILSGGGMLSGTAVGAGISAIGTGLSSGFMSSVYGGLGGMSGAISGGLSVGGLGGVATAIGAIAAPLLAVAAIFSFFKKKVKELDSGLQGTITTLDATIESFKTLETKRFWGLSKKVSTEAEALDKEAAEPLLEAIRGIQQGVMDAADMFGIASDVFDKFSYEFKLSLKGLSEDEQIQKVNEELDKMGDSFASLTGRFETMNELLEAASQRYDLTTRLLQLQGNAEELLRRQREAEMAATHDMNKALLQHIYTLEDAAIAINNAEVALSEANAAYEESTRVFESALSDLRRLMDEAAAAAQRAVDSAYDSLKGAMESAMGAAIDAVDSAQADLERAVGARVERINKSFDRILDHLNYKLDVASQKANASRDIFELLDSSLRGRGVTSESTSFASRQQALSYVSSGGTDMDKLSDALGVLNEPSEKFFGTFQEYARDFAVTSNAIKGSRDAAEATMSADERAVALLEDQISQNEVARDLQIQQVEALLGTEEAVLSVEEALIAVEKALAAMTTLENQHKELVAQFPLLSEDVVSVASAVDALTEALAHKDVIAAQHSELVAQFPMLNQSVLSIGQAINNLASAQAAQAAAAKAQADAQAAATAATKAAEQKILVGSKIQEITEKAEALLSRPQNPFGSNSGRYLSLKAYREQITDLGGTPTFATGGMHSGGLRMVGERGPELEATGPSRIFSHNQTASMFRDPDLREAVRDLKEEVSGLRSEQRQIQMGISKYTKRSYDIERKWDVDGLPATRT